MKKVVLASVIGLSLIFTGCAKISSMRASVQIKSAQKYLLSEDYEKAIVRLNKAIAMDPKNVEAHLLLVEAYQKSDMNEEAEEVLEKLRDFDELTEDQEEKLEALDSRKVYKDILMNFYNTGIIAGIDIFSTDNDVTGYSSIEDNRFWSYFFKLMDVTGDGKDEIIIYEREKAENDIGGDLIIVQIIKDKPIKIYLNNCGSSYNTSTFILDNNMIIANYYGDASNYDYIDAYSYNSDIVQFEKNTKQKDMAIDLADNNKIKLNIEDMDTAINPENISKAVDNMKISDSGLQESPKKPDKKENKKTIENYKELYRDILEEHYNNTSYEDTFRLEDITGDGQDELIVKEHYPEHSVYCYIYEVNGDNVNRIFDESCPEFRFLENGNILVLYETDYYNDPTEYDYYVYDKDISRFRLEKHGKYRKGDKEYFDKLANKPVKLYVWDVNTELNLSNIDEALR